MRAWRSPPDGYVRAGAIDLDNDPRLKRTLLLAGVGWTIVCVLVICGAAGAARSLTFQVDGRSAAGWVGFGAFVLGVALAGVLAVVLHEAVHGIFIWLFTGDRPVFGFKGWYAYAGAPGWYFRRTPFLVVLLAPFVLVTAAGMVLYLVLPSTAAVVALVVALCNAIGSIGDLYICVRLSALRGSVVLEDRADGMAWWLPALEGQAAT
jgi:hypothetical protein